MRATPTWFLQVDHRLDVSIAMLAADIAMSTTVEPHGYFPRLEREPKLQTNFARAVEQMHDPKE